MSKVTPDSYQENVKTDILAAVKKMSKQIFWELSNKMTKQIF